MVNKEDDNRQGWEDTGDRNKTGLSLEKQGNRKTEAGVDGESVLERAANLDGIELGIDGDNQRGENIGQIKR